MGTIGGWVLACTAMLACSSREEPLPIGQAAPTAVPLPDLQDTWSTQGDDLSGFGIAVASGDMDGDGWPELVVGAHTTGTELAGAVHVFRGGPGGPQLDTIIKGDTVQGLLGNSLVVADVDGDGLQDLVVGAPGVSTASVPNVGPGRVAVYRGGESLDRAAWVLEGPEDNAKFGYLGASGDLDGDGDDEIVVRMYGLEQTLVYPGGPDGPGAPWILDGAVTGTAVVGDLNADGFDDLVIADRFAADTADRAGEVRIHLGGPAGPDAEPAMVLVGSSTGEELGDTVAGAGDVDGDGFADLLVAAPGHVEQGVATGRIALHRGTADGVEVEASWVFTGGVTEPPPPKIGHAAAALGDVNGDGYDDVALGAPLFHAELGTNQGRAWVFLGGADGLRSEPWWQIDGPWAQAWLGAAVASAGDADGDGFPDVVVSAYEFGRDQAGQTGWVSLYTTGCGFGCP